MHAGDVLSCSVAGAAQGAVQPSAQPAGGAGFVTLEDFTFLGLIRDPKSRSSLTRLAHFRRENASYASGPDSIIPPVNFDSQADRSRKAREEHRDRT